MTHSDEANGWATAEGARLRAVRRPDGAWSAWLPEEQPGSWPALLDAAIKDGCSPVLVSRPAVQSAAAVAALRQSGLRPVRTETIWQVPVDAIPTTTVRTPHRIVSVTEFDPDEVAGLDNIIRADIPGTQTWAGTGAQLSESLDDPEFDPQLYLVAQHSETGSLDGLVRVWNRRPVPRLGCVGVTVPWRRSGLVLALLQQVARTLRTRGMTHIVAETDDTNRDSFLLARNHRGQALESIVEWQSLDTYGRLLPDSPG